MDFYDDIDVDFGDKSELGVGDIISLLEDNESKKDKRNRNGKKKEIVFDNEIGDDECEPYDPTKLNYLYGAVSPDLVDDIAREVGEVTGNNLLNEQLEHQYNVVNYVSVPKKKTKNKTLSKEKKPAKPDTNITKKSELRKEMASNIGEPVSDAKVTFCKRKKNALINGLNLPENGNWIDRPASPEQTVVQEEIAPPVHNPYAMDKVRHWLDNLDDSYSEGSFYTPNTTDESTLSYCTANSDTPKRSYRATSKRSSASKITAITDAVIGFKTSPKTTTILPPATSKPKLTITPKKTSEIYIPGSYNREFHYKSNDFPAMR